MGEFRHCTDGKGTQALFRRKGNSGTVLTGRELKHCTDGRGIQALN